METTQRITEVWKEINDINDWDESRFEWKKAYIASIFAKMAYLHIPENELKNVDRANLIPCAEYRDILSGSPSPGLQAILTASDFGEFFIVEKPLVVTVVVKIRNVLFISMRGTQNLYDWIVNLHATKSRPYARTDMDIFFHKGFHRAVASCMFEIQSEIGRRFAGENTVYVTGHSLGGALAAILHALWSEEIRHYRYIGQNPWRSDVTTHCCYTFGMPRYGNFHAAEHFPSPYHIYNKDDIVPTVPPKLLGFDDCLIEYCLTSDGRVDGGNVKGSSFSEFIFKLVTRKGIREHDMEIYMSRTKSVQAAHK